MTNRLDECHLIPGVLSCEGQMVFRPVFPEIYAKVYPDWTCGAPTPDHEGHSSTVGV